MCKLLSTIFPTLLFITFLSDSFGKDFTCRPYIENNQPETKEIAIYTSTKLNCHIASQPNCTKPILNWYFNGTLISGKRSKYYQRNNSLLIKNFQQEDHGLYTCVMESSSGRDTHNFTLHAIEPPPTLAAIYKDIIKDTSKALPEKVYWLPNMMTTTPVVAAVAEDMNLRLTCFFYIVSKEIPKTRWYFRPQSTAGQSGRRQRIRTKGYLTTYGIKQQTFPCSIYPIVSYNKGECFENTLYIDSISDKDLGQYTCSVKKPQPQENPLEFNFTLNSTQPREFAEYDYDDDYNPLTDDNYVTVKARNTTQFLSLSLLSDFNTNSTICAGKNFTFYCKAGIYPQRISIIRLDGSYNIAAGNPGNYTEVASKKGHKQHAFLDLTYHLHNVRDSSGYACGGYPDLNGNWQYKYMYLAVDDNCQHEVIKYDPTLIRKVIPAVGGGCLIILIIAITLIIHCYRKLQYVRKLPVEKRLVVERNEFYGQDPTGPNTPLIPPEVRVEVGTRGRLWMFRPLPSADSDSGLSSSGTRYQLPYDPAWEFPRERLMVGAKLGEGAFGVVYGGEARDIHGVSGVTKVAIKMLRDAFDQQEVVDLVKEMEVMKLLGHHKNIINLLGTCTRSLPPCILVEFSEHGNLREFLIERRPNKKMPDPTLEHPVLTNTNLIDFGRQVAEGMAYLASKSIVHRDLAARNILVGTDLVMKVADFGLTRVVDDYYRKMSDGRLPVKWMAPESLFDRKSTIKSDVWSFGIVLWEIFSFGGTPYPSIRVADLFQTLRAGHRNDRPAYASDEVYHLMRQCWFANPDSRPSFDALLMKLAIRLEVEPEILTVRNYLDMTGTETSSSSGVLTDSMGYVASSAAPTCSTQDTSEGPPQGYMNMTSPPSSLLYECESAQKSDFDSYYMSSGVPTTSAPLPPTTYPYVNVASPSLKKVNLSRMPSTRSTRDTEEPQAYINSPTLVTFGKKAVYISPPRLPTSGPASPSSYVNVTSPVAPDVVGTAYINVPTSPSSNAVSKPSPTEGITPEDGASRSNSICSDDAFLSPGHSGPLAGHPRTITVHTGSCSSYQGNPSSPGTTDEGYPTSVRTESCTSYSADDPFSPTEMTQMVASIEEEERGCSETSRDLELPQNAQVTQYV